MNDMTSPQFATTEDRLYILDPSRARIISCRTDGQDLRVVKEQVKGIPDGIAIDAHTGRSFVSLMGANFMKNDGSIFELDLQTGDTTPVVPEGDTFTPKQIILEPRSQKLYWCDREGMRVMRSNRDGSDLETLVQTGQTDEERRDSTLWCVGIAVDLQGEKIYWTQKGGDNANQGRIFRAGIDLLPGESPARRSDIELLFRDLPEPIDLEFVPQNRRLYWTDRGAPPKGNTVNYTEVDTLKPGVTEATIIGGDLKEGIGLAVDYTGNRIYVTDLGGNLHSMALDGSDRKLLLEKAGLFTGVALLKVR